MTERQIKAEIARMKAEIARLNQEAESVRQETKRHNARAEFFKWQLNMVTGGASA